ncbi:DNA-directed RNA polymerase III, subunit Rpc31 [Amylocarpus encephaloides]|uniref:DNA-directed RNA polymerase III subunit n=1 Tax=Amylocarpus encephaloides TaxID=45428 RepID=A0A9P7YHN1_9HELO|nr:DNA-directed RNA polymerase III, subunit Rpc31 [Amylocarpus encephaloides]
MSRGGRGGGGMRGGLKGATWDQEATKDIKPDNKPLENYPAHPNLKRPPPLSDIEMRQFKYYKTLQTQIHRGPLYTQATRRNVDNPGKTFSEDQFNRQYGTNRKADMDPFTGVETYSMRYLPKQNVIPTLSGRPFNKELFPRELWSTLEGKDGEDVRKSINKAMHKRARHLASDADPKAKEQALMDKILAITGEDENEEAEEEDKEDEEVDSEFDDDEIGDDYNAEQYFNNGDDADEGDDGDGGGGGDDY